MPPEPAFLIGILHGVILILLVQTYRRRKASKLAAQRGAEKPIDSLVAENKQLRGDVSTLANRIKVLERIATDPAERTAREIDALR